MARMTVKGSEELYAMLESVQNHSQEIASRVVYEGAGVVVRAMAAAVAALPTDDSFGTADHPKSGPSSIQKAGLVNSLGVAPHKHGGGKTDTSIGFDGYNALRTKRWPSGQPNAMVARSVERGTSFMRPNPIIKRSVSASKGAAVAKMEQTAKEEIQKLTK